MQQMELIGKEFGMKKAFLTVFRGMPHQSPRQTLSAHASRPRFTDNANAAPHEITDNTTAFDIYQRKYGCVPVLSFLFSFPLSESST
jgi:hypothetical protein